MPSDDAANPPPIVITTTTTIRIREAIPAVDGWHVVLPDGPERIRFARVACWSIIEDSTGAREVVPLVAGASRALVPAPQTALGVASPGETLADWRERLGRASPPAASAPPARERERRPELTSASSSSADDEAKPVPGSRRTLRSSGEHDAKPRPAPTPTPAPPAARPKPKGDDIMGAGVFDDDE